MQLELAFGNADSIRHALESRTGIPFVVTVTDNSSRIVSFRPEGGKQPARLRIHRMFLQAGPRVIDALALWLTTSRSRASARIVDGFIADHEHLIGRGVARRAPFRTTGQCFDLQELFDEVNAEHFDEQVTSAITWGRRPTIRNPRSIRLGSYTPEDDLIRIHPALDQSFVPGYFIRYIVYHEMLHAVLGVEPAGNGRRRIHTAEFTRRERAYPDYLRACAWHDDRTNLDRLLNPPARAA